VHISLGRVAKLSGGLKNILGGVGAPPQKNSSMIY
jgi:hypothetical protein